MFPLPNFSFSLPFSLSEKEQSKEWNSLTNMKTKTDKNKTKWKGQSKKSTKLSLRSFCAGQVRLGPGLALECGW